jgi:hypothetical protein
MMKIILNSILTFAPLVQILQNDKCAITSLKVFLGYQSYNGKSQSWGGLRCDGHKTKRTPIWIYTCCPCGTTFRIVL